MVHHASLPDDQVVRPEHCLLVVEVTLVGSDKGKLPIKDPVELDLDLDMDLEEPH